MNKQTLLLVLCGLSFILLLGCTQEKLKEQNENVFILGKDLAEKNETMNQTRQSSQNQTRVLPEQPQEPKLSSFTVETGNPAYVAMEQANFTVTLHSESEIPGVRVLVYGVQLKSGRNLLDDNRLLYVRPGLNTANFALELPSCSTCSGMLAGEYNVFAKAVMGNRTLAESNCSFNFTAGSSH